MTAGHARPAARTNTPHRMTKPAVTNPDPGPYLRDWGLQAPQAAYESGSGGGCGGGESLQPKLTGRLNPIPCRDLSLAPRWR